MFEPSTAFSAENRSVPPGAAPGSDLPRPKRRVHGRLQRLCELYGACDAMRSLFDTLDRVASASATVIILGESGSGKEIVANAIHLLSDRRNRPFIATNSDPLPHMLLDTHLFVHS